MAEPARARQSTPLLEVKGLAFDYGGVHAVQDCGFDVADGGITALIGGNGAGKSTSVLAVSGARRARKGSIRFDGADILGLAAHEVVELGLALVPEGRLVFQHLSVHENLLVAGHCTRSRANLQQNLNHVYNGSRDCRNGASRMQARFRAGNSRCWRSDAG